VAARGFIAEKWQDTRRQSRSCPTSQEAKKCEPTWNYVGFPDGSIEEPTITGMKSHAANLQRILGKHFLFQTLTL